jgi:hypothetical protein
LSAPAPSARNQNRSGKIQRPGPESPGGPRVERACEVCKNLFWPRAVDVAAGKGRHCSTNCSSKALRKPKLCACGKPRSYKATKCRSCKRLRRCEFCYQAFTPRTPKASKRFCCPGHAIDANRARVTIAGVEFTVAEVATVLGTSSKSLCEKLRDRRGESPEQALFRSRRNGGRPGQPRERPLTFGGETLLIGEWARRLGISQQALSKRIRHGWPLAKALTHRPAKAAPPTPSSK